MKKGFDGALTDTGWINVGDPGAPAFQNGWVNFGSGYVVARFRRLNGLTHVQYAVKSGTLGQIGFVLPAGYRPGYYLHLVGSSATTPARIDVTTAGEVYINGASTVINTLVGSFPAEA